MPDPVDVHRGNESIAAMAGNNVQELEVSHNGGLYHGRVKPVVKVATNLIGEGELSVHALDQVQR